MATDKQKNRRGLIYAAGIILLFVAILGISQCSDSSAYTMNPEKWNIRVIIPIVVAAFVGLMLFLRSKDK